jgi:signal transduction histidine kinase/HAMP domain-containing protein
MDCCLDVGMIGFMFKKNKNRGFRSLRKKLVLRLGFTYLFALLFVFALIIIKNTVDFNESIAEIESRTKAALVNKGMLLVSNNSNALIGLVDDNAFTAVEQIVSKIVASDQDIVYGVFSDLDNNDWVSAFKSKELSIFKPSVDANAQWAFQQTEAASKHIQFGSVIVIEFAAPVLLQGKALGVIRYGLSTIVLTEAIASANKKATKSLIQTLIGLLLVSVITLVVTFWRTDKVAKQITVPLNLLTDAADVVANGQYDQAINVKTNDEIGLLANNFSSMTNTIKRTIGDLAEINKIGGELARTRDELDAFKWVLQGVFRQLKFEFCLAFNTDRYNNINIITHYHQKDEVDPIDSKQVMELVTGNLDIAESLKEEMQDGDYLEIGLAKEGNNTGYCSLVLLPFGSRSGEKLYLVLLTGVTNKKINQSEVDFCLSISHMLATSLQNISMNELLAEQNKTLEDKVAIRTQELYVQNEALSGTLKELEQAQNQLVEAEKMASLGSLVAGISHEVNTPLGVSVTAASHLNERTEVFKTKFNEGKLTKSGFISYLTGAAEATEIILTNLDRAATLVQSFKQIAVDQSSDVEAKFNVRQHLESLIISLRPTYKTLPIDIELIGEDIIETTSYPGLLTQVITNLIVNSIKHGLKDCEQGKINIILKLVENVISIAVEDNGVGIPDEIKGKVFDPFFTTSRGTGGSGLGLNIVYNLVKQKLHGEIELSDNQPKGTKFTVTFPKV